jgi:hypothetical protein
VLWEVFEHMRSSLAGQRLVTEAGLTHELAEHFAAGAARPFDFAIVDEAQDLSAPQLRFLGALAGDQPNYSSSPATSASGSSNSRSRGSRSASTCAGARAACG